MAVNATAVWRCRPSGLNTNGGGYDSAISGAGTDYSQQNSPQASGTNATCTTGTSTFVDATANAFTSAMVGNCIQIASGTNFTVGFYFVTAFTSASTVTLDRSPVGGANGSAGVWKLGGAWGSSAANVLTNLLATGSPVVGGNIVYFLGSGTPNPSSYTYDFLCSGTGASTSLQLTTSVLFANDPATPGYKAPPDTTGGMPVIKCTDRFDASSTDLNYQGLYFVDAGSGRQLMAPTNALFFGCVYDEFGTSNASAQIFASGSIDVISTEIFNSTGTGTNNTVFALTSPVGMVANCNIHDLNGGGAISTVGGTRVVGCIISNNVSHGISIATALANGVGGDALINCTVDANGGEQIFAQITGTENPSAVMLTSNIITNAITARHGIRFANGTTGAGGNDGQKHLIDYNVFYNNVGGNYANVSAGPHDTALGSTPYVNQSIENYTLA